MKLKSYEAIKRFMGKGKTCDELFPKVDLRSYWKFYREGKFYFDDKNLKHKVIK